MLIAYIDEVGEAGAFISKDHKRFNTSPVFGYAGFVVPEQGLKDKKSWSEPDLSALRCEKVWFKVVGGQL